mgnify:CR=1 FL=1
MAGFDNYLISMFAIADTVRSTARETIEALNKRKIETYMLTGDNEGTAQNIAEIAGIKKENVIAQVMPQFKAQKVKELKNKGKIVAMVGDGINDAPALAEADVGIAMGAGTDVAIETADVVLIKNDPKDVLKAIELSKLTIRKIKQNLFWALCYNSIGIPIAAGILFPLTKTILITPEMAAAFMALSSISVTTNSLLMKRKEI